MKIYTPEMLKLIFECSYKYDLSVNQGIKLPADDTFSKLGKIFHTLADRKFKGIDTRESEIPDNLKKIWTNFLSLNINSVYLSEYTFNVKINNDAVLTGRIDAILRKNENFVIADWKTGSKTLPEEDMQTICYMYAVYNVLKFKNLINSFENLSMTYFFLKDNSRKTVSFNEKKYYEYQKIIRNSILQKNKIHRGNCVKCSYKCLCKDITEPNRQEEIQNVSV